MSRTKLILAGLLALLVVGVVATASTSTPASASGSCMKVGTPAYCVEGTPLVSTSENVEGTSGSAILKATIGGTTAEVKCASGKSTGTIEGGAAGTIGKSKTKITFETCKLLAPEHCKLTSAEETKIKTTELVGELQYTGGKVLDKLEPKVGAFASISIEGESLCGIGEIGKPETFNITGSQLCEVDSGKTEAETETEKHKLICKASGSTNLAIGGNPAEITDETMAIELSGAKAHGHWSVKET
jgi:hypothetical protein